MKTIVLTAGALLALGAQAAPVAKTVEYREGDAVLEGFLVYDDRHEGRRPAVIVVHDWMGPGPFGQAKAEALAGLGYLAFAADIYGKGVRPANPQEAARQSGRFKRDPALMRARAAAALEVVRRHRLVDPGRIGVIGYCFGGTVALELARSGAPIAGAVSFHGGLGTPAPAGPGQIKGAVLALHGADDPHVPPGEVAAFEDEMRAVGADWQLVKYGGSVHAFTNPAAGSDASRGAAYNGRSDRRSWEAMKDFFDEIFKRP